MWSSVPETVPIGVATPASKHIGVVGASLRGLFPLLKMSASGPEGDIAPDQLLKADGCKFSLAAPLRVGVVLNSAGQGANPLA